MSETRPNHLLFVCSGNICRSPMAHVLAEELAGALGKRVEVRSASTLGLDGRVADSHAVAVCAEIGLDLGQHRSQPLTDALVDWADYVLVMELAHAAYIRQNHPQVGERLFPLGVFAGQGDIADPIGGWRFQFRRTRETLKTAVDAFLRRIPREQKVAR